MFVGIALVGTTFLIYSKLYYEIPKDVKPIRITPQTFSEAEDVLLIIEIGCYAICLIIFVHVLKTIYNRWFSTDPNARYNEHYQKIIANQNRLMVIDDDYIIPESNYENTTYTPFIPKSRYQNEMLLNINNYNFYKRRFVYPTNRSKEDSSQSSIKVASYRSQFVTSDNLSYPKTNYGNTTNTAFIPESRFQIEMLRRRNTETYSHEIDSNYKVEYPLRLFGSKEYTPQLFRKQCVKNTMFLIKCLYVIDQLKAPFNYNSQTSYVTREIPIHDDEYIYISRRFKRKQNYLKITKIEKVQNPFLIIQYEFKKCENLNKYKKLEEKLLFHGTQKGKISSICNTNFDWRLSGSSKGYRHGQGVYFTPHVSFSNCFGNKGFQRVVIASKVLVSNYCIGSEGMVIPPLMYDTTTDNSLGLYVKYDDNMFCPMYNIYYNDFRKV